jgi:sugar/nucleoside kinase (ribokinase family)
VTIAADVIDPERKLVVAVGSALVDILAHEDERFLQSTGAEKGGMTYVDKEFIEQTLARSSSRPQIVPGGSACNTALGIGMLGGRARFVGKCGNGVMGNLFVEDLKKHHVEPLLLRSDSSTGRVLSIVTPDAQRSMFTFLGASAETLPEELSELHFAEAAVVHIEGYLLFNPDLILKALKAAKAVGAAVSLDLASFSVVRESKDLLQDIVEKYVDILLANEDEALAFTGCSDHSLAIEALAQSAPIAVLKLGRRGSRIAHKGTVAVVPARGDGRAVDTTGAGDLWASGFLFGLVQGYPLSRCGELASVCGYEVCQVMGSHIPAAGWQRIRSLLG